MDRILITGGAGYIGSTLVPLLISEGYKVTVLDNFLYKQASLNQICHEKNFKIINGDVRIKSTIEKELKEHDIIIPLAALVGAPLCSKDPISASSTNFEAIELMLKLTSKSQVIIMPTTNSAYGSGDNNNFCDENSPLKPISQYAIEKVKVEKLLMEKENTISLRLATVFGMSPRMRTDLLVNDFVYRAVYDKFVVLFESSFKRNYIHVKDVSRAFIHCIKEFNSMKNEIYNVGLSSANISKLELCQIIKKYINNFTFLESELNKDPDQRNYIVSNQKIEASGFTPEYTIDDGIIELIKGYTMIKNSKYSNV